MCFIGRYNCFFAIYITIANEIHAFTGDPEVPAVTYPAIPIRNETKAMEIYSSIFKRVYIDPTLWNPDIQCSFNVYVPNIV